MMKLIDLVDKIQAKPYETRVRILWGTALAATAIIIVIWALNLRSTFNGVSKSDLIKISNPADSVALTNKTFAGAERIERTGGLLKIYFNFENSTDDILNISKLDDITLLINGKTVKAQKITDRQNNPFVQKILSRTKNFGILYYPQTEGKDAILTFDRMFLESTPGSLFQQKLELDLEKLNNKADLRN